MFQTEKGLINNPRFLKGGKGTILFDGLQPLDRDIHDDGLVEFGHEDTTLLEIGLAADLARGVELRCASAVRVPPANLRAFASDFAGSCHSRSMVT